jgi:hypothetical protein
MATALIQNFTTFLRLTVSMKTVWQCVAGQIWYDAVAPGNNLLEALAKCAADGRLTREAQATLQLLAK